MESIVLDLLILGNCGHFSLDKVENIITMSEGIVCCGNCLEEVCWDKFTDTLRRAYDVEPGRYYRKIYVSRNSFESLVRVLNEFLKKSGITGGVRTGSSSELVKRGKRLYDVLNLLYRYGVINTESSSDDCSLVGHHADEYCHLLTSIYKSSESCHPTCALICIDKTFSMSHLEQLILEIKSKYKKSVDRKVCSFNEKIKIVDLNIFKKDTIS